MRLVFPTLVRPKKSAKAIAHKLSLPLSSVQAAVARACGYGDWHDFQKNYARGSVFALDQQLERSQFIERQTILSLRLAKELSIPDGDAQYALADSRLTGDRPVMLAEQIDLRLNCWRQTTLSPASKRTRGAIGVLNSPGRNGEVVILRKYGQPTSIIGHKEVGTVSDFEYVSPRSPAAMFLPLRLYLPYGYWTEGDGATVVFSRDYKPMWRVREGYAPERLDPSLWIKWREQNWFWDESCAPWANGDIRRAMEARLVKLGIQVLPVWADVLPIAVREDAIDRFSEALDQLMSSRGQQTVIAA